MKPGRELDALVVEKVMGWKWLSGNPWAPSTDIAAAWEVLEKMRERGYTVEVFFGWESGKDFQKDDWVAEFDDITDEHLGVAKTAPSRYGSG